MKIKTKFTLALLIAAMLPLVVAMTVTLWQSTGQLRVLTVDAARGQLRAGAEKLSGYFACRLAEISAYAETPVVRSMQWQQTGPFLKWVFDRHNGTYEKLIVANDQSHYFSTSGGNPALDGRTSFNDADPDARPKTLSQRRYWQFLVGDNRSSEQRTYISEPIISYTTGVRQVLVGATIVSASGERVLGMVGGTIQWQTIAALIDTVRNDLFNRFGPSARLSLVTQTGTYAYHWDPAKTIRLKRDEKGRPVLNAIGEKKVVLAKITEEPADALAEAGRQMIQGKGGYAFFSDPETGRQMAVVYAPVPAADWAMALVIPKAQILAPVRGLQWSFAAITLGALLLVLATAVLLAQRITRPIEALTAATRGLERGHWHIELSTEGMDEVGELARSFTEMAVVLEKRETALKESEERYRNLYASSRRAEEVYRSLLHSSADAIVLYDLEGGTVYLSPAFSRMFGWSMEEMRGRKIPFVPESEREATMAVIGELIANGTPCHGFETRRQTKDGQILHVSISASRYNDHRDQPTGMLVVLRDITGRKRMERQLQQAAKLEAVGTLAGGIAHDFNNLMMAMLGNLSLVLMNMEPGHPDFGKLKKIEKLIQSGSRLTSQLLGYAQKGRYEMTRIDPNQVIRETVETFGRTRKEIGIHLDLADDLRSIKGDPAQIEQILMNLYVNASDAMPGGGDLFIKTRNVGHDDFGSPLYTPKPGNYVMLSVADTGTGIDDRLVERIFDPFFTTKEMGRGTGLGLAMVYGTVKGHDGYIDVAAKAGKGARFWIYLPAAEAAVSLEQPMPRPVTAGNETILIVDDEAIVLDVGVQILKAMGYRVFSAAGGQAAIDRYRQSPDTIDLVILDMIMPGKGGGAVFDAIRKINPAARVLLSSGYSIDGQAREILDRGCNGFIQKPFNMEKLSKKIREILETGRPTG